MGEIDLILEWAQDKPWFDISFVLSIQEAFDKYGRLTEAQTNAIYNIIDRFNIE